jgi:ABC-type transport system involved in multi-copper enzyme maturation permease subunit
MSLLKKVFTKQFSTVILSVLATVFCIWTLSTLFLSLAKGENKTAQISFVVWAISSFAYAFMCPWAVETVLKYKNYIDKIEGYLALFTTTAYSAAIAFLIRNGELAMWRNEAESTLYALEAVFFVGSLAIAARRATKVGKTHPLHWIIWPWMEKRKGAK